MVQTTHAFFKRECYKIVLEDILAQREVRAADGTDTSISIFFIYFSLYTNASSVTGQYWYVTETDSGISITLCQCGICSSAYMCVCVCVFGKAAGFGDNSTVNE